MEITKNYYKTVEIPVFSPCKQRRNFASQSQCDRVNCWWLHRPRLHSLGNRTFGHRSCSRQHLSSAAYRPTSLYSLAIEPNNDKFICRKIDKTRRHLAQSKFHRYQVLRDRKLMDQFGVLIDCCCCLVDGLFSRCVIWSNNYRFFFVHLFVVCKTHHFGVCFWARIMVVSIDAKHAKCQII